MTEVWDDEPTLKATTLLIALALADHANDEGACWPGVDALARRARCSARQTQRALADLIEEGVVVAPEGQRSEERPFIVGRQNVIRHGRHIGVGHSEGEAGTPTSDPRVEVPKEESPSEPPSARPPTKRQLEDAVIERVWSYWVEISGKKRSRLDAKRKGHIRNALQIGFTEDEIKLALLGLWRSPFHQGENQQNRRYLDLNYALRGIGDESDDTRIEKSILWAALYSPNTQRITQAKVEQYLDEMRYTRSLEHKPELERAKHAYRQMVAAGFRVIMFDKAPWVRVER